MTEQQCNAEARLPLQLFPHFALRHPLFVYLDSQGLLPLYHYLQLIDEGILPWGSSWDLKYAMVEPNASLEVNSGKVLKLIARSKKCIQNI